jgi:DMSO/TMAO reductase YedYZ heme-binding membrane subunit
MTAWMAVTWDATRSGGFVAYILLTLAVALGLLLSLRVQSPTRWPRYVNDQLHQFLTLLALAFGVVHGAAAWLDPFMRFTPAEVLVPFVSHYRPVWMAFGIVAFYLGLAVGLSVLVRRRIGYRLWRWFHYLAYAVFVLATIHGLGTGSDTRTAWGLGIYVAAVGVVGGLTLLRLLRPVGRGAKAHPGWAVVVAFGMLAGCVWAATGPLRPGWNRIANGGHGSGARIALATVNTGSVQSPVSGLWTGRLQTGRSFEDGGGSVELTGTWRGDLLSVLLVGYPAGSQFVVQGGRCLLETPTGQTWSGAVQLGGSGLEATLSPSGGGTTVLLTVTGLETNGAMGTFQATVQATTATNAIP